MSDDKFAIGERVFAKMKGYPYWPAKVVERVAGKEEKYRINFYGTHDESIVKLDQMVLYNEETKVKHGKPQRKAQFKEALEEIETEIDALTKNTDSVGGEGEEAPEESEGELMIDEGPPSLPPVLTREIIKPEIVETAKGKRPRSLAKRDSLTSTTPSAPILSAAEPPPPEIVSRSGRKIKPKRFADDEITSPITVVGKGATKNAASTPTSEDGPPAKRAKRASKSIGKANAPPTSAPITPSDEVAPETPTSKAKIVVGKGRNSTAPNSKVISRLSPDIITPSPANNRGPPDLKPASVRRSGSSSNKQLPALVSSATPVRKSGRQMRSKSTEQLDDDNVSTAETEAMEVDDKENSVNSDSEIQPQQDADTESNEESVAVSGKTNKRPIVVAQKVQQPVGEKNVRVSGKNGLQFELSYNAQHPKPINDEDAKKWQVTAAKNIEKLKEDLSQSDSESQDIINSCAEAIENLDSEEVKARERRSMQIKLLRLEGEVIEIIGEIVGCLSITTADCDRAIELLDRLASHQLNQLMLKKHPEVVHTIRKLRCYIGNVEEWGLDSEQQIQFEAKSLAIRQKAVEVHKHFYELFCESPEVPFAQVFRAQVEKFNKSVAGLPMKTILGLTEVDESGELQEFEMEMNGNGDEEGDLEEAVGETEENEHLEQDTVGGNGELAQALAEPEDAEGEIENAEAEDADPETEEGEIDANEEEFEEAIED